MWIAANASNESKDQDLISHLLRNLADQVNGSNMSELYRASQSLLNAGTSVGMPEKVSYLMSDGSFAKLLCFLRSFWI